MKRVKTGKSAKKVAGTKTYSFALAAVWLAVAALAMIAGILYFSGWFSHPTQRACTMEAMMCPDGSYVGRTGPNCEFSACPVVNDSNPKACPALAKLCPDGSYVTMSGPNCEFSACPTPNPASCEAKSVDSCQSTVGCIVCPPCAACSSISCHTSQFCKNIGFSETWYNETVNANCTCPQGYVKEGSTCNPACYYSTPKCLSPSIECTPAN